jgi:hypothetical protein
MAGHSRELVRMAIVRIREASPFSVPERRQGRKLRLLTLLRTQDQTRRFFKPRSDRPPSLQLAHARLQSTADLPANSMSLKQP